MIWEDHLKSEDIGILIFWMLSLISSHTLFIFYSLNFEKQIQNKKQGSWHNICD